MMPGGWRTLFRQSVSLNVFFDIHAMPENNSLTELLQNFVFFVTVIAMLLLLNGCGAKKKAPEEVVELDPGQQRIEAWYDLMREKQTAPEMEKLESVNNFFNRLEFVDDRHLWGREDYWATPREMLVKNGGDCEDFATAKYFTLRQLNVPEEKMRMTYVKALQLKQPHMVLSFYPAPSADPLVLDSLVKRILTASERSDLIPIYSFNGQNLWLAKKQGSDRLGGADRLSLWQELQLRFNREAVAAPMPE
jgi:predicted transglutaminase-like cysteine proteinase